ISERPSATTSRATRRNIGSPSRVSSTFSPPIRRAAPAARRTAVICVGVDGAESMAAANLLMSAMGSESADRRADLLRARNWSIFAALSFYAPAAEDQDMAKEPVESQAEESSEVPAAVRSPWAPSIRATLGFRNYWYPALFEHELDGGVAKGVRLLGENLLLRRVGDRVAAVEDRCLHRGVRFSRKPECYTADTITCWYHGFTYNLLDGKLVDILTEPGSKMIGKIGIKTYPVVEAKGIVFTFIGDASPPDLADDVPPGFLDDELAVNGIRDPVQSNWRIGAENGFDTTHIYIHRDSPLIGGNRILLPIGL